MLERLTQRLEYSTAEFRQFVKEQDTAVGQTHLARPRQGAATNEGDIGACVMRRAKRPRTNQSAARRKQARDGMDRRHGECFIERERGQHAG